MQADSVAFKALSSLEKCTLRHLRSRRSFQALILSERLQAVGTSFDRCRSVRYRQLEQKKHQLEQKRKRLEAIHVGAPSH